MKFNLFRPGLALVAAAATAAGFAGTTLTSHADLQPVQCPASPVSAVAGNGSSLQANGVAAAITAYAGASGCGAGVSGTVTYTATGSGTCITEADTNSAAVQYCGTDLPYQQQDWATMHASGWGAIQTIPIALSAVDYVTLSSNCAAGDNLSGATLGKIFTGQITDWHSVDAVNCAVGTTVKVAVRSNSCSGTTGAAKRYLTKKDPADFATIEANHPCDNVWTGLTASCSASTNQALVTSCLVDANTITYLDDSDAAAHSPGVVQHAIDNAAPVNAFSTYTSGSCGAAATAGVTPPTTAANWANLEDITDPPTGYADCTYTFQLARTAGTVNGGAGLTTAQGANVRGFIEFEVSTAGQAAFASANYDVLPASVLAEAQAGAASL